MCLKGPTVQASHAPIETGLGTPQQPPTVQPRQRADFKIAIICALEIESDAVEALFDGYWKDQGWDFGKVSGDTNAYTTGWLCGHNVVLVHMPGIGKANSASTAAHLLSSFPEIKLGLVVGICGGVPGGEGTDEIILGNVVISTGIVQFDFGRHYPDKFETKNTPEDNVGRPNAEIRAFLHRLKTKRGRASILTSMNNYLQKFCEKEGMRYPGIDEDKLYPPDYRHKHHNPHDCDTCARCVKWDDAVCQAALESTCQQLCCDPTKVITRNRFKGLSGGPGSSTTAPIPCIHFGCIASGVWDNIPTIIIKGICDYADSHKNKLWQEYAAASAAASAAACMRPVLGMWQAAEGRQSFSDAEVERSIIIEKLSSAIDNVQLDQFLEVLSVFDQEMNKSVLSSTYFDRPDTHWTFRNIDFQTWSKSNDNVVLWLASQSDYNISEIASMVVENGMNGISQKVVLHFSFHCSIEEKDAVITLIHTLLSQIINQSETRKRLLIVRKFLRLLIHGFHNLVEVDLEKMKFRAADSLVEHVRNLLNVQQGLDLWAALGGILSDEPQDLLLVVTGLQEISFECGQQIIDGIHGITKRLHSRFKILLASKPSAIFQKVPFDNLLTIEYDKERQDCLSSLHFSDIRYDTIAREHNGSLQWIWEHKAYRRWSPSDSSSLLYVEGKPGSGKSTLTKYFRDHLQERETFTQPTVTGKFFYSHREGESHTSHASMLRTVLYDILRQDESFFYHRFQGEYRRLCASQPSVRPNAAKWDYESLKKVFSSLFDYSGKGRLYLMLDAIDESEENHRQDMLQLLLQLCEKTTNFVAKIFVASRPLPVLERSVRKSQEFIRLQDETRSDISKFARSYLESLEFDGYLDDAMNYIVENAQGLFLWVQLVATELLNYDEEGRAEGDIFEFLKSLPRELEDFYERMLTKMGKKDVDLRHGIRMLYFVLFALRPLMVTELLHAIAIQDTKEESFTPSDIDFNKRIPRERRITYCGGNFLEIKQSHGSLSVQVMHQTVREFFLKPGGYVSKSDFRIDHKEAQKCVFKACLQYLRLCVANVFSSNRPQHVDAWTLNHFEGLAKYLNTRPFAVYALSYLKHHMGNNDQDQTTDLETMSLSINESPLLSGSYLLGAWARSQLGLAPLNNPQADTERKFREKILRSAARCGLSVAGEIMLAAGTDINARDHINRTALWYAAKYGHQNVVTMLLAHKEIDLDARSIDEKSPLLVAAAAGHTAIVRQLHAQNVDVNCKDNKGRTPVWYANKNKHGAVVEFLRGIR